MDPITKPGIQLATQPAGAPTSSRSSSAVLRIPELLENIFNLVETTVTDPWYNKESGPARAPHFADFALVCRDWNDLATTFLYRDIEIYWRCSTGNPLLRTLSITPRLASQVTSLQLFGWGMVDLEEEPNPNDEEEGKDREARKLRKRRIDRYEERAALDSKWIGENNESEESEESYTRLLDLIRYLPNLRHFRIYCHLRPMVWDFTPPSFFPDTAGVINHLDSLELVNVMGPVA